MLAIRMQRTGRKGHAMFRVVVQDSRLTPTSGKVVAQIGHYDPHGKSITLDKEKAKFYLEHGAQPSDRVARMFKKEGVKLPSWVKISEKNVRTVRNPEKRRSTNPEKPEADQADAPETSTSAPEKEAATEAAAPEAATANDQKTETTGAEKPASASEETSAEADEPATESKETK